MYWDDKKLKEEKLVKRNRRREVHGKKAKPRSKAWKWILNLLIFAFAGVFVYAAYHLFSDFMVYHHNRQVKNEIQEVIYQEIGEETLEYKDLVRDDGTKIDILTPLRKINPEIIGWIHIDDTTIDYPVVQGTDNDYYLNHNVYKEETICGSIFMDKDNELGQPRQNYILYGHRMNDDSMFGHVSKFLKEDFFNEHPTFTLILEDGYYTCEVFAVYQTTTFGFQYYQNMLGSSEDQFQQFIMSCKSMSKFQRNVEITPEDTIVTLSTCDYALDVDTGRLVLQAKMVKQGEEEAPQEETEEASEEDAAEEDAEEESED